MTISFACVHLSIHMCGVNAAAFKLVISPKTMYYVTYVFGLDVSSVERPPIFVVNYQVHM